MFFSRKYSCVAAWLTLFPMVLHAVEPVWWTQQETRIKDPQAQVNNYAPVNLGQLKNTAKQARKYLDTALQQFGGAGPDVEALVEGFATGPSDNYLPANLGQLKVVAKPFYDRLQEIGFDTQLNLIEHGYPETWVYGYPWNPETPVEQNYVPANLGQLKIVFSFDLATDSDGDGIPDWWEVKYGLRADDPADASGHLDDDGLSNLAEFLHGSDPRLRDSDNDGLDDALEIALGLRPNKADTNGNGVEDGKEDTDGDNVANDVDGWPSTGLIKIPRQPVPRYAVLKIVEGNRWVPLSINVRGDVLFQENSNTLFYCALGQSQPTTILNSNPKVKDSFDGNPIGIGIADDGKVVGTWQRFVPNDPLEVNNPSAAGTMKDYFKWKPGDQSITYLDKSFGAPSSFTLNAPASGSTSSMFIPTAMTQGGTVYGYGRIDGGFESSRFVGVGAPGAGGVAVTSYAQKAREVANIFLNDKNKSGSLYWNGQMMLLGSGGHLFYSFDLFDNYSTAENLPEADLGLYFSGGGSFRKVSVDLTGAVAMNSDDTILGGSSLSVRQPDYTWAPVSAPMRSNSRLGIGGGAQTVLWYSFNNKLQAVGLRAKADFSDSDWVVLINDTDYSLKSLISAGWTLNSVVKINEEGMILAKAKYKDDQEASVVVLMPVELKDIKGDGDADDQVIESMPAKGQSESENAYIQRQWGDNHIALIDPHRGQGDTPDMPRLVAKLPGGPQGLKVKWRLDVEYKRGNGYRAAYVQDFTRAEDNVQIPWTAEMDANQECRIFEGDPWKNEIRDRGFFGGTAKLYLWFTSQAEPTEPMITFRIGGKNPDPGKAKTFINSVAGTQFWYAYAIAKHETYGRVRENRQIRYYNQFYTSYQGGPIGDNSDDMGWAAWAKAWPIYNLDRASKTGPQNGPGGYGVFQLTLGPKHPNDSTANEDFIKRKEIWNWQDNTRRAIQELQGKVAQSQSLFNGLQATYPASGAIPNHLRFSGLESIVITYYNGMFGGKLERVRVNGYKKNPSSCWKPLSNGWRFLPNVNNYVDSVSRRVE